AAAINRQVELVGTTTGRALQAHQISMERPEGMSPASMADLAERLPNLNHVDFTNTVLRAATEKPAEMPKMWSQVAVIPKAAAEVVNSFLLSGPKIMAKILMTAGTFAYRIAETGLHEV